MSETTQRGGEGIKTLGCRRCGDQWTDMPIGVPTDAVMVDICVYGKRVQNSRLHFCSEECVIAAADDVAEHAHDFLATEIGRS